MSYITGYKEETDKNYEQVMYLIAKVQSSFLKVFGAFMALYRAQKERY